MKTLVSPTVRRPRRWTIATSRTPEVLDGLGAEKAQLLDGHLLVGLVVEVQSAAAAGIVANDAVEDADGTVSAGPDGALDGCGVDGLTHESDERGFGCVEASLTGGRIATSSPSWRMQVRGLYC